MISYTYINLINAVILLFKPTQHGYIATHGIVLEEINYIMNRCQERPIPLVSRMGVQQGLLVVFLREIYNM